MFTGQGGGAPVDKMLACLKYALRLDGVVDSDLVAAGTPELDERERREFSARYSRIRGRLRAATDPLWITGEEALESSGSSITDG
jgi:hypothetical protein